MVREIDSVLNSPDPNFELIIFYDQSPNNIDKGISDERVRHLTNPHNLGLVETANTAMKIVHGERLSFINSDDVYILKFLETLYQAEAEESVDIEVIAYVLATVNEDGTKRTPHRKQPETYESKSVMLRLMRERIISYPCNKIFRKEHFTNLKSPLINRV
ncbi:MAG: glycosyltransferase [Rothia sp. (in: high G+C Gram-positive bacteria)]|nr:glycosyltransferase [Rothia sp. (in: high G+C Gram-positive bacteria)]